MALTFNNEIGEWNKINKIHTYDYNGDLINLKSSRLDMLITPNHRIFYKTQKGKFKLTEISKMPNTNTRVNIPISVKNKQKDFDIQDEYLTLLGWILTDGHINR